MREFALAAVAVVVLLGISGCAQSKEEQAASAVERGTNCFRSANYDKAIIAFNKAIELDPENASAYHCRGLAYQQKAENDKAEADFARAKELGYKTE